MTGFGQRCGRVLRIFTLLTFGAICCLVSIGVANRFLPLGSMGWSDEIWRQGLHFRVDIVPNLLRGRTSGTVLELFLLCASLVFLAAFTYQAWELMLQASDKSPIFSLSRRLWYAPMPIAGAIMCAVTLRDLVVRVRTLLPRRAT